MTPELLCQLAGTVVIGWGAFTVMRASGSTTRKNVLANLLSALAMLLFVRLIVDFGGWADWFIYVWLLCLAGYGIGAYRVTTVWSDLPWQATDTKARRSETSSLGFSGLLALAVAGALVVPGTLLT